MFHNTIKVKDNEMNKNTKSNKLKNKLGLNWAKHSSSWNWDLLHLLTRYTWTIHVARAVPNNLFQT